MCHLGAIRYYLRFHEAIPVLRADYSRAPHPSAAMPIKNIGIARLACLIHAASVHSEPGSNSPRTTWHQKRQKNFKEQMLTANLLLQICSYPKNNCQTLTDYCSKEVTFFEVGVRITDQEYFVKYFLRIVSC